MPDLAQNIIQNIIQETPQDITPDIPEDIPEDTSNRLRRKRLVYRASHRGMRELDVTFGAWVTHLHASGGLNEDRLDGLERLLERSEPDLLALLCDGELAQGKEERQLMQELIEFISDNSVTIFGEKES